jgi:predicted Zn-dependent protease
MRRDRNGCSFDLALNGALAVPVAPPEERTRRPGGQIFITRALFDRLGDEGGVAGVIGHEIGHVIGRHSAERIAKARLTEGLTGAAVIASYDPDNPASMRTAQVAILIGQVINLRYGREDELEADFLGVCFMHQAGHDPSQLIRVMEVLAEASQGPSPPEFFSTHPNPENRIGRIQQAIQNLDRCPAPRTGARRFVPGAIWGVCVWRLRRLRRGCGPLLQCFRSTPPSTVLKAGIGDENRF